MRFPDRQQLTLKRSFTPLGIEASILETVNCGTESGEQIGVVSTGDLCVNCWCCDNSGRDLECEVGVSRRDGGEIYKDA